MKKIKKYINIDVVLVLLITAICISIFIKPLNSLDELWNFSYAQNIYRGYKPYTDFNMVSTPLSAYLSAVFLGLFGNELFSIRVLGFLLIIITAALFYMISCLILKNKAISFSITIYILLLHIQEFVYEYNYLNLCIVLLIILTVYKDIYSVNDRYRLIRNIGIGLLFGITPLIKQSTGMLLLISNLIICVWECMKFKEKKNIYILRFVSSLLPVAAFALWLINKNIIWDFYDYAILGIGSFKNNYVSYVQFAISSPINGFMALLPMIALILFIRGIKTDSKDGKRFSINLMLVAAAQFSLVYPIADINHFGIAIVPVTILILSYVKTDSVTYKQEGECVLATVIIAIICLLGIHSYDDIKLSSLKHFRYIPISSALEENIYVIDEYINTMTNMGYKTYIADASAVAFMIPLDIYNKDMDMLLIGNTGTKEIVDILDNRKNVLYLLLKNKNKLNWQSDYRILNYIRENYAYFGEVSVYDVYKSE